jgi:hypothetical protein
MGVSERETGGGGGESEVNKNFLNFFLPLPGGAMIEDVVWMGVWLGKIERQRVMCQSMQETKMGADMCCDIWTGDVQMRERKKLRCMGKAGLQRCV